MLQLAPVAFQKRHRPLCIKVPGCSICPAKPAIKYVVRFSEIFYCHSVITGFGILLSGMPSQCMKVALLMGIYIGHNEVCSINIPGVCGQFSPAASVAIESYLSVIERCVLLRRYLNR